MRSELLQLAADLAQREEPFVLAVVVRRRPASSSQPGNMAIISAAGEFHGWLGGSCTQPTVVREAQRALADGQPRLLHLRPDPEAERRPGVDVFPMTCQSHAPRFVVVAAMGGHDEEAIRAALALSPEPGAAASPTCGGASGGRSATVANSSPWPGSTWPWSASPPACPTGRAAPGSASAWPNSSICTWTSW